MTNDDAGVCESWEDIDAREPPEKPASSVKSQPTTNLNVENKEFSGLSTYKPQLKVLPRSPSTNNKSSESSTSRNDEKESMVPSLSERERLYKKSKERIFGSQNK